LDKKIDSADLRELLTYIGQGNDGNKPMSKLLITLWGALTPIKTLQLAKDLVKEGYITKEQGRLLLTSKGKEFIKYPKSLKG